MSERTSSDKLDQWEDSFSSGLIANSRKQEEPWLTGNVHVVEDAPLQPEPVRSEPGFILVTSQVDGLVDLTENRPVHCEREARLGDPASARERTTKSRTFRGGIARTLS